MARRRDPFNPTDPVHLTSGQRLAEVAAILAADLLRPCLRQRAATGTNVRPCHTRNYCAEDTEAPPGSRPYHRLGDLWDGARILQWESSAWWSAPRLA